MRTGNSVQQKDVSDKPKAPPQDDTFDIVTMMKHPWKNMSFTEGGVWTGVVLKVFSESTTMRIVGTLMIVSGVTLMWRTLHRARCHKKESE
jgi:hypothetical protein